MVNEYKLKEYRDLDLVSENDHILCVRYGEFLAKNYRPNWLNISSIEALAVGYYERMVKHKPFNQRLTKASEILVAIENEYGIGAQ